MKWGTENAAIALVGFGSYQLFSMYKETVPTLAEVRAHPHGDPYISQRMMDGNLLVGGVAVINGLTLSVLTKSVMPFLIVVGGFGILALWFRAVYKSQPVTPPDAEGTGA